jgi:hypothetical protein
MIVWLVWHNDDEFTRTNIHALSGIWTRGFNVQVIKAYASDSAATGTDANYTAAVISFP